MSVHTSNQMVTFHLVFNVMFWLLWVWIYIPRKCWETVLHYTWTIGYFTSCLLTSAGKLTISYPRKCGESAIQCLRKWSNHLLLYPVECGETFIQYSHWLWRYVDRTFNGGLMIQFTKKILEKLKQIASALWRRTRAPVIVMLIKVVSVLYDALLQQRLSNCRQIEGHTSLLLSISFLFLVRIQ